MGQYLRGFADPPMEMGIRLDGRLMGAVSLMFLEDSPTSAEFGYWIGAEQEGKGIVTRCVTALMNYAADHLNVEQFIIGCAVNNRRSRAIPERLGYQLKETIPNGEVIGEYVYDRLVFGLPASLWRARREAAGQEHKP
jgi:ribosomal-protein-serine acetyltransferase